MEKMSNAVVISGSESESDEPTDLDGLGNKLSSEDWKRLNENDCITDKVISNYLELLRSHAQEKSQLSVSILSSFFTAKMLTSGYSSVATWYSKVNIIETDIVLAIFNDGGIHWTMMVIEVKERRMRYYDSISTMETRYFILLKNYFYERYTIDKNGWICEIADGIPKQTNGIDCGIFLLEYARCLLLRIPLTFTQKTTGAIRRRVAQELASSLLQLGDVQSCNCTAEHSPVQPNTCEQLKPSVIDVTPSYEDMQNSCCKISIEDDTFEQQDTPKVEVKLDFNEELGTSSDQSESDDEIGSANSCVPKQWDTLPCELQSVLPPEYSYLIEEFTNLNTENNATNNGMPVFHTQFRINLQKEESALQWLKDFQSHSKCTYRVTRTYKPLLKRVKYKLDMHCQHFKKKLTDKQLVRTSSSKQKPCSLVSSVRKKKTQCKSRLSITIQVPPKIMVKKCPQASNLKQFHTLVKLLFDHNHLIESAHALSFRPILDETKEKYLSLFRMGHSASSAHFYYETLLLTNQSENVQQNLADRACNPSKQDVYRLFSKWRQTELGDDNGEGLFEQLQHEVAVYNEKWKGQGGKAKFQPFTLGDDENNNTDEADCDDPEVSMPKPKRQKRERSQPFVLAVCTPLMARAHASLPQAAEIMFCDATSSLDRFNTALFILSTCHPAGGIPLAVLMTSDEKLPTIHSGLEMLKDILPTHAFHGSGVERGPQLIMTDDSTTEKGALRKMWPKSTQLLCLFHFLQRRWTWLWEGKNKIQHSDRATLIGLAKKIVYASTEQQFQQHVQELKKNSTALKYPQFLKHMESLYSSRHEWALSYRKDIPIRGNHTNNYSEATIGILKELIFKRVKAYNLVQMFEFVTEALELYHQRKLLSVAHNRVDCFISIKYKGLNASKISKEHIKKSTEDEDHFIVKSSRDPENSYHVDMSLGTCSCKRGQDGSPCSHQAAVVLHYHHRSFNFIPTMHTPSRMQLAYLAMGDKAEQKSEFYTDISQSQDDTTKSFPSTEPTISDTSWALIREGAKDVNETLNSTDDHCGNENATSTKSMDTALQDVFQDITNKLKENDPQFSTGIQKFVAQYNKMKTNAALASCFHRFGKVNGGKTTVLHGGGIRYGVRIPIQASAAGRRKYGKRGKGPAPKGRRPALSKAHCLNTSNRYIMTIRKEPKGKRLHNLTANICTGQQNAGKW